MKPSEAPATDLSFLLITAEGLIVDAHESACLAIGWTRAELVNKPMSDILEYGHDLLMTHLQELQAAPPVEGGTSVSFSALVRKSDQTNIPATAIVRPVPELDCFAVGFEDLPGDNAEATQALAANEVQAIEPEIAIAPAPVMETIQPVIENVQLSDPLDMPEAGLNFAPRVPVEENPIASLRDLQKPQGKSNGDGTSFRNIFLSGSTRNAVESNGSNGANGVEEIAAQLETERQERRRLEARVLSLNDQLQQLHLQLKNNLETENIYHKRISESEEAVRNAEQSKTDAEVALGEQKKKQGLVEQNLTQLKAACAQREQERKAWQQEWLAKLESSLAALKESDARLEKEIATRRGIDVTLQMLRQDFYAHSKEPQLNVTVSEPKSRANADLVEAAN